MNSGLAAERGCGTREAAGIYAVVPTGRNGRPLEDFLIDLPIIIPDGWGVHALGVTLLPDPSEVAALVASGLTNEAAWEQAATWHVVDLVGQAHYPNVADVLEEGRRFGFSRRLPSTLEFSKLSDRSRLLLGHERGHIDNAFSYRAALDREGRPHGECPRCPQHKHGHSDPFLYPVGSVGPSFLAEPNALSCAGLWWEDLDREEGYEALDGDGRTMVRFMPSFAYTANERPEGITPQYQAALIANLPLRHIEVVNDPDGGRHEANAARARMSGLSVTIESE